MATQQVDAYFRVRVAVLANSLRNRFDELNSRDFPNEAPNEVIALIKQALLSIGVQIEHADDKILPLIFQLLATYQQVLSFLDNAHTEQTPRGLVSVLRDLLNRISEGSRFVASPQSKYNYGILDIQPHLVGPLANLLPLADLQALPRISASKIHLILFPRAERDNILLHAVFGHEIGHLLATEYLTTEEGTQQFQQSFQQVVEAVSKARPASPSTDTIALLRQRIELSNRIAQVRKRAMEELISDYVGVMLFGPSALLASYEIFCLSPIDRLPAGAELYPPSRYRLRFLMEAITEESFVTTLEECAGNGGQQEPFLTGARQHLETIAALVSENTDLQALQKDVLINETYQWIKSSLQGAKDFVKQRLPVDMVYSAKIFKDEVPELIGRLVLNVPPSELGKFPNVTIPAWQSALLAGWFVRIVGKRFSNGNEVPFSLNDYDGLQRLVLRAIENIGLNKEYNDHMTGAT